MSAKKPFVEPRILSDVELDSAERNFPLMPLLAGSGGSADAADGSDATQPDPAYDGSDA